VREVTPRANGRLKDLSYSLAPVPHRASCYKLLEEKEMLGRVALPVRHLRANPRVASLQP